MSSEYTAGMRVIIRDEEWMVRRTERNTLGNTALYCLGVSPLVRGREQIFLSDLEQIEVVDPAKVRLVADDSAHYVRSLLYLESNWRQKTPTDDKLHIGYKGCMDPMPFQLEPAQMALKQTRQRILIADGVGLGKTLEAGILVSELIERGRGRRILVVTSKSMMTQFQKEFWNRFTIPLVRLDSARIQRIRENLPVNANPFFYYDKTIISMDTLKRYIEYRTHLENATWDIIIIDEAQNVARRSGRWAQRSRLAELLAGRSDTMIMLSATPHDGRRESLASLMRMLDPTAIADVENYTEEDLRGLFIRRFKKDIRSQVQGTFLERNVKLEKCEASDKENDAYDFFADMKLIMDEGKQRGSGQLFKTSLQKALFSSPAACIKSIDERLKKLGKKYDRGMADIPALEKLKDYLTKITDQDFSRYQQLLSILRDPVYDWHKDDTEDRLVIFTERVETMHYLAEHLTLDLGMPEGSVQEISGEMTDVQQQEIVEDFGRRESPMRILVATDVASEGLNLHYLCHRLIHFDIPWSLMAFQQRNGRIDRYGQTKRPDIRYLVETCRNSDVRGDLRNLEILVEKEKQAQKNIGDPALLLGQFEIRGEELIVAGAMEKNETGDAFSNLFAGNDKAQQKFNAVEALLAGANPKEKTRDQIKVDMTDDQTLYSDHDYLFRSMSYLGQKENVQIEEQRAIDGVDITLTTEMKKRLKAQIPEEAMPQGDHLVLSSSRKYCMQQMKESMQQSMNISAWPVVQYLWKQHPIFSYVNERMDLNFGRNEVPVIGLHSGLRSGQVLFIVNGCFLNRRSEPLIDDWFGVLYTGTNFEKTMSMEEAVRLTGIGSEELVNALDVHEAEINAASRLLGDAVDRAGRHLAKDQESFSQQIAPKLDDELDRLVKLEDRHKKHNADHNTGKKKEVVDRQVDELFKRFTNWVQDAMTAEKKPYVRIVAVMMGVGHEH